MYAYVCVRMCKEKLTEDFGAEEYLAVTSFHSFHA